MDLRLASASPRRKHLLSGLGLSFSVDPMDVDERPKQGENPEEYVGRLAEEKAQAALAALGDGPPILAADTVVAIGAQLIGKPRDLAEAKAHLSALSGRWHEVYTGVAVYGSSLAQQTVCTEVRFRSLSAGEIDRYVSEHEPLDKAGAYGIQGEAGAFVAELKGSYTNVIGLPLEETLALLLRAGVELSDD